MLEFTPVVKKDEIQCRIAEIAKAISAGYQGRMLVLIGVLKVAFFFLTGLARQLNLVTVKNRFYSSFQLWCR